MTWRDDLLPASFRGIPFLYEDTERGGGRRLAEFEFPFRNDAYIEDMGRRKRTHKITGYVLGDDYISQREALEKALEDDGPGTLMHPYRGQITVNIGPFSSSETRQFGRGARFTIECVESGDQPSPTSSDATQEQASDAADDVFEQLDVSFEEDWEVVGGPILEQAIDLLDVLSEAFLTLVFWPGVVTLSFAELVFDLALLVNDASALAGAITLFCDQYAAACVASVVPFDEEFSSRGPDLTVDPAYGLDVLAQFGSTLPAPGRDRAGKNQIAIVALVEGAATAAIAKIYAQTDFAAQEDADVARDQVSGFIDNLALNAADAGDDAAYSAFQALYQASTTDLTIRAKQAPSTIVYSFGDAMPALVLANRFYGDSGRAGDLIARNNAPHPLFMPVQVEALTA